MDTRLMSSRLLVPVTSRRCTGYYARALATHPPRRNCREMPSSSLSSFDVNPTFPRNCRIGRRRSPRRISAVSAEPSQVEVTWQILVGTLAGVTPFVVAGIEFSKRIVAQRKCDECGGSGLVMREKYYVRCPNCGGFLPWQSWKRFFSG